MVSQFYFCVRVQKLDTYWTSFEFRIFYCGKNNNRNLTTHVYICLLFRNAEPVHQTRLSRNAMATPVADIAQHMKFVSDLSSAENLLYPSDEVMEEVSDNDGLVVREDGATDS